MLTPGPPERKPPRPLAELLDRAAALRHVRATTALPAHCRSSLLHQITGFELASQVLGHACNQYNLVFMDTAEQDHCTTELVLQLINQRQKRLAQVL